MRLWAIAFVLTFATACSSDDDNGDDNNNNETGTNHSYEITLSTGGEANTYSGVLENFIPLSIHVIDPETDWEIVTLGINDENLTISSIFILNQDGQPYPLSYEDYGNEDGISSIMTFAVDNTNLLSTSGSATFSNFQLLENPNELESVASYSLEFSGTFLDPINDITYQGSGTVVVAPMNFPF